MKNRQRPLNFLMPPIAIRNLIYHVCPLTTNDIWKWNIEQLKRRIDLFNGKRHIAIAVGEGLHPPAVVKEAFDDPRCTFFEIPNDKTLREVASFLPLLVSVQSTRSNEALFYAHTKGNSTDNKGTGPRLWTTMMYQKLLGEWQKCIDLLQTYNAVGTNFMAWIGQSPYPSGLAHSNWMFAGTFWWARHDRIFGHPNWRYVPADRYGAEAYLAGLSPHHAVISVYQKWPPGDFPKVSPYDPKLYAGDNWEQYE
jgi:hypothetical protein